MTQRTCIVINSYNKVKYLWSTCAAGLQKYWPDNPYKIYWITNGNEDVPLGTALNGGADENWSAMMRTVLPKIKHDIIIWLVDDYWLTRVVDTQLINRYCQHIIKGNADYIKLLPSPYATAISTFDGSVAEFDNDARYKTSLGPSIWRKSLLEELIHSNENIWQFELESASRLRNKYKMFCSRKHAIPIVGEDPKAPYTTQPVEKGIVSSSAYEYAADVGTMLLPPFPIISNYTRIRYPGLLTVADFSIIDDFTYISVKCDVGMVSHIGTNCSIIGGKDASFSCGKFCALSAGTRIICGTDDFINDIATTLPRGLLTKVKNHMLLGTVVLEDYVTIGTNTVIMPNVRIPEGTTIGALSVVTSSHKLEPWSVYKTKNGELVKVADRNKDNVMNQVNSVLELLN